MCLDISRIYHKDIPGRLACCDVRRRFSYSLIPPTAKPLYCIEIEGREAKPNTPRITVYKSLTGFCEQLARFYESLTGFFARLAGFYARLIKFYASLTKFFGRLTGFCELLTKFYAWLARFYESPGKLYEPLKSACKGSPRGWSAVSGACPETRGHTASPDTHS